MRVEEALGGVADARTLVHSRRPTGIFIQVDHVVVRRRVQDVGLAVKIAHVFAILVDAGLVAFIRPKVIWLVMGALLVA